MSDNYLNIQRKPTAALTVSDMELLDAAHKLNDRMKRTIFDEGTVYTSILNPEGEILAMHGFGLADLKKLLGGSVQVADPG